MKCDWPTTMFASAGKFMRTAESSSIRDPSVALASIPAATAAAKGQGEACGGHLLRFVRSQNPATSRAHTVYTFIVYSNRNPS
jgi:hypothetical protein